MRFWLGTHEVSWLERTDVDLFISHRRLAKRRRLPKARGAWALDSGGFTELSMFGEWRTSENEYVDAVQRYQDEIGNLAWAAPMDWMCEPWIVEKTGATIRHHQEWTTENYLRLRDRGPFIPVLQGWTVDDYDQHLAIYYRYGVDLTSLPLVGIGSVCRRQQMRETSELVAFLHYAGVKLHGFGMKMQGLAQMGWALESSDSLAWSYRARRAGQQPGCTHKACSSCLTFALLWRERILATQQMQQPTLEGL